MNLQQTFTFAILGGGDRGRLFANWVADRPDIGRVVAVAETQYCASGRTGATLRH